jgi:hypothetical protein
LRPKAGVPDSLDTDRHERDRLAVVRAVEVTAAGEEVKEPDLSAKRNMVPGTGPEMAWARGLRFAAGYLEVRRP